MKLDDFLKCKKVRCVKGYDDCLKIGKEYDVIDISVEIKVKDDEGNFLYWEFDHFEPVLDSAENPLQGVELTPEFEAVPKFKVGDKVYFPRLSKKLCVIGAGQEDDYVDEINGSKALAEMQSDLDFVYDQKTNSWLWGEKDCAPQLLHATPENYELLCKLYPHIEFEQPAKELKGSDLCRAMLDKGWKYVPCYVSNTSDKNAVELDDCGVIYTVNHNGNFQDGYGETWCHVVPFDLRTGEPLTEAVLDE